MNGKKEFRSAADQKKKAKTVNQTWRPERTNLKGQCGPSSEKFSVKVDVGSSLIRFVRGKGGSTQKRIEEEMGVKIMIPSSKKEEFVVIEGYSVDSVTKASERIQSIIEEAIKSPSLDYSHFVSLPLAIHTELVEKLLNFQSSILGSSKASKTSTPSDLGIDKSIFIKPETFHLTVLMLKLWNKERVDAASEVLKGISSKIMDALDNKPVLIRLKGLDCMRGSPAKAYVLYAPVEEDGRLQRACQVIIDEFTKAGLALEKDAERFKLHATIMNVRHRKRNKRKKNDSFDAREIFKQYGTEEWGVYHIREAHLSQRFAFDENGYYRCCASDCMRGSLSKARVLCAPVEEIDEDGRFLRACQVIVDEFTEAGLILEKDTKHKLKLQATVMIARHRKRKRGSIHWMLVKLISHKDLHSGKMDTTTAVLLHLSPNICKLTHQLPKLQVTTMQAESFKLF